MAAGRILGVGLDSTEGVNVLRAGGHKVILADSLLAAERRSGEEQLDLIILDQHLGDQVSLGFIERLKQAGLEAPILALAEQGEWAAEAIRCGADQCLVKPADPRVLLAILERGLAQATGREPGQPGASHTAEFEASPFFGISAAMRHLEEHALKVLDLDRPVLIQGETGVGKSALARWIHAHGARKHGPFVELNCAGLSRDLLESELFGHEKGAFTGAVSTKSGLMEAANGGTVFLDEIGDMDLQVQPKMLKAIEEHQYRRLGDVRDRVLDIRLIGATHRNLQQLAEQGMFRKDLFYRVGGLPIRIPPLRKRPEDIAPLAAFYLERFGQEWQCGPLELTTEAERLMEGYAWPGNIRELKNALERAIVNRKGPLLHAGDFQLGRPWDAASGEVRSVNSGEVKALSMTLDEVEKGHIRRVLSAVGGHVDEAARHLGISRSSLYQRIQRFGLRLDKP